MNQKGFSLIELVIVVIILGILAATALPRFLDVTNEAKAANIEGMAGGFATGVSLARAQWEAEGRPQDGSNANTVWYDGSQVYLTVEDRNSSPPVSPGYPTSVNSFTGSNMNNARCIEVWNAILQNPPSITSSQDSTVIAENRYYTQSVTDPNNAAGGNVCGYWLVSTLLRDGTDSRIILPTSDLNVGNNFVYDPKSGRVTINITIRN